MTTTLRKEFTKTLALFLPGIFLLGFNIGTGSVMGVMGIIADICYDWSKTVIDGGIAPVYFAAFFITLVYFIFWNGRTQFFERTLAVIVAIVAACFLLNFFIMMPPPMDILKGMIPNLPEVSADQGKGPFLVLASMVGTTVFSGLFIIRTTLVKEAGWTIKDVKKQRNDAIVSTTLMFVISGAIMAAAAGTLYAGGIGLSKASQMITLLELDAGADSVLRSIDYYRRTCRPSPSRQEDLAAEWTFFQRNQHRTPYACFRRRGLLIGSGPVEAACKSIVKTRLCRSGMRWSREGGQRILDFRCYVKPGLWNEFWDACKNLRPSD